jgi:hypothetical protein
MTEMILTNKEPVPSAAGEIDKDELSIYLYNMIKTYVNMRNEPQPYYGFASLTEKWQEYDRCYMVKAKDNRQEWEYQGFSNIVTPDFFESIDIKVSKEMKSLFNGAKLFTTKPSKYSNLQDAILAQRLVEHNWDRIAAFQTEVRKLARDRRVYGTWFAYTPWTVDEEVVEEIAGETEDETGEIVELIKYTNLQQVSTKRVYLNPNVENIQDQEGIIIQITYSYDQLLNMEADGIIEVGMADYVKDRYRNFTGDEDLDTDTTDSINEEGTTVVDRNLLSYKLWLAYFKRGTGKSRCVYEAIYMWNDKVLGCREYINKKRYPIKKGVFHVIPDFAYGIAQGDIIYPTYIAKCARINQVFDRETLEILGGGFKDAQSLPSFAGRKPGVFQNVNGLQAITAQGGKPVITWGELDGSRPASTALEIVPMLDRMMRSGTGATETLAGMPTHSQVDRTAAGLTLVAEQAEDRIGSELALFEDEFLRCFAEECYDNYQKFLIPEVDLPKMFDEEELTYTDATGVTQPIIFSKMLRRVKFVFLSAQRVIDKEEKIGKINKLLVFLQQLGMSVPAIGQLLTEKTNFEYLVTEYAAALDITDMDRLFPKFNAIGELLKTRTQLKQSEMQAQMMGMGLQEVQQKLQEIDDGAALNIIGDVMQKMQQMQQGQQQQQQAGPQQPVMGQ